MRDVDDDRRCTGWHSHPTPASATWGHPVVTQAHTHGHGRPFIATIAGFVATIAGFIATIAGFVVHCGRITVGLGADTAVNPDRIVTLRFQRQLRDTTAHDRVQSR